MFDGLDSATLKDPGERRTSHFRSRMIAVEKMKRLQERREREVYDKCVNR